MHLDVPHPGSLQIHDLTGRARIPQRLVQADRRPQLLCQPRMTDEFIRMKRLLDVQQFRVVERAQSAFIARPLVGPIGIHGERQLAPLEPLSRRADGGLVPPGRDFDLDAAVAVPHRVVDRARQLRGFAAGRNTQRHAAGDTRGGCNADPFGEERREAGVAAIRLEVPRRGFDAGAREPVAPHAVAQRGIDRLGTIEFLTDDARQQYARDHVAGAHQRLFRIERKLKRGRLAEADVAGFVVQHDDDGSAFGHRPAGDDERLDQRQGELEQLSAGDTHRAGDRDSAASGFALEHDSEETVARVKDQNVQRALGPRSVRRRILLQRKLKKSVQLD